jgi:ribonuclease P protein component
MVVLRAAPGPAAAFRFGIVASKRLGNAVTRNRARRLIREGIRRLAGSIRSGWDVVVIARSRIVGTDARQVQVALEDLFTRAGLLTGPSKDTSSADKSAF